MHAHTTRDDVEQVIGEVDDFLLEKILAVGASKAELHEAALVAVIDYEMGERVYSRSNDRVDALCTIIEELLDLDEEAQDDPHSYTQDRNGGRHDRW